MLVGMAEELEAGMSSLHLAQHGSAQTNPVESGAVVAQGELIGSASRQKCPGVIVQTGARVALVIGNRDDVARNAAQHRACARLRLSSQLSPLSQQVVIVAGERHDFLALAQSLA